MFSLKCFQVIKQGDLEFRPTALEEINWNSDTAEDLSRCLYYQISNNILLAEKLSSSLVARNFKGRFIGDATKLRIEKSISTHVLPFNLGVSIFDQRVMSRINGNIATYCVVLLENSEYRGHVYTSILSLDARVCLGFGFQRNIEYYIDQDYSKNFYLFEGIRLFALREGCTSLEFFTRINKDHKYFEEYVPPYNFKTSNRIPYTKYITTAIYQIFKIRPYLSEDIRTPFTKFNNIRFYESNIKDIEELSGKISLPPSSYDWSVRTIGGKWNGNYILERIDVGAYNLKDELSRTGIDRIIPFKNNRISGRYLQIQITREFSENISEEKDYCNGVYNGFVRFYKKGELDRVYSFINGIIIEGYQRKRSLPGFIRSGSNTLINLMEPSEFWEDFLEVRVED